MARLGRTMVPPVARLLRRAAAGALGPRALAHSPNRTCSMLYNALKLAHVYPSSCGSEAWCPFLSAPRRAIAGAAAAHRVDERRAPALSGRRGRGRARGAGQRGCGWWSRMAKQAVQSGSSFSMPLSWTLLGHAGAGDDGHLRPHPFRAVPAPAAAVAASDWPAGGQAMVGIRRWVGINLALGVLVVVITLVF